METAHDSAQKPSFGHAAYIAVVTQCILKQAIISKIQSNFNTSL